MADEVLPGGIPGIRLPYQEEEEERYGPTTQQHLETVQAAQEAGAARARQMHEEGYRLPISDLENEALNEALVQVAETGGDIDEAKYKLASAMHYSRLFRIPVENVMQDFDAINKYYLGTTGIPSKTNWEAIKDAWRAGTILLDFNNAARAWKNSGGQDSEAERQADDLYGRMQDLHDKIPRPWYIQLLKAGAEAAPFTLDVMAATLAGQTAGMAGAMLMAGGITGAGYMVVGTKGMAAIPLATIAAFGTAAAMSMGLDRAVLDQEGIEYYRMRKLGVDHSIAAPVSGIAANVLGLIEVSLGNIPGLIGAVGGKAATNAITGVLMKKIGVRNLLGPVARAGMNYVVQGLEEGLEEAVQQFVSNTADIVAQELQGYDIEVSAKDFTEGMGESFKQGVMASVMLGIPGSMISYRGNQTEARQLNRMAGDLDLEDFIAFAKKEDVSILENMTEADQTTVLTQIWESQQQRQQIRERQQPIQPTTEEQVLAAEAEETAGAAPDVIGQVVRLESGRLYTTEEITLGETEEGIVEARMLVGDPTPGSGRRYGYINYTEEAETVTITDIKTSPGYDAIRRDMILELAASHPGKQIIWNPRSKTLQAIKQELITSNPRGEEFGLQWFETPGEVGELVRISDIKRRLTEAAPQIRPELQEGFIQMVTPIAQARGQTLDQFMGEVFEEEMFTRDPTKVSVAQGKRGGTRLRQYAGKYRALVYLTENADFTTLSHEFIHAVEPHLAATDRAVIREVFGEDREGLPVAFEKYLMTGQAPTTELRDLFRRIADWFKEVYRKISGAVDVDPRIKEVFDRLFTEGVPTAVEPEEARVSARAEPSLSRLDRETGERPNQPVATEQEVYDTVKEGLPAFMAWVEDLGKKYGMKILHRPANPAEEGYRVKTRERAARKVTEDKGWETVLDIGGASLIAPDYETLFKLGQELYESDRVVRIKDRFAEDMEGYRDMLVNVRMDNGAVYEIQLHMPQYLEAKKVLGHKIYQILDDLAAAEVIGEEYNNIRDIMRNLYDLAGVFASESRSFSAASFDMGTAVSAISENLTAVRGWNVLSDRTRNLLRDLDSTATTLSSQSKNSNPGLFISILHPPSYSIAQGSDPNKVLFQHEAWHGGAAEFERFATEHIGTGEGHAAFGWGLYFTESEDIAREYAGSIAQQRAMEMDPREIFDEEAAETFERLNPWGVAVVAHALMNSNRKEEALGSIEAEIRQTEERIKEHRESGLPEQSIERLLSTDQEYADQLRTIYNGIERTHIPFPLAHRNLYKVRLFSNKMEGQDYRWLDWLEEVPQETIEELTESLVDKEARSREVSENDPSPAVREWFKEQTKMWGNYLRGLTGAQKTLRGEVTGETLYNALAEAVGRKEASLFLLSQGIDGIRYPSGTLSGITDSDINNYVVFDDSQVEIEEHILYQQAYHGSGQSFNRFMNKFIGTGEGNAAFGYGLYFTEVENIAKSYADEQGYFRFENLTVGDLPLIVGAERSTYPRDPSNPRDIARATVTENLLMDQWLLAEEYSEAGNKGVWARVRYVIRNLIVQRLDAVETSPLTAEVVEELRRLMPDSPDDITVQTETTRNLYRVNLFKDREPRLIEWYGEIGEARLKIMEAARELSTEHADRIKRERYNTIAYDLQAYSDNSDFRRIYDMISGQIGKADTSRLLLRAGYDGIVYPTGTLSGIKDSPYKNYVIFDENAIEIEEHIVFQSSPEMIAEAKQTRKEATREHQRVLDMRIAQRKQKDPEMQDLYTKMINSERERFRQDSLFYAHIISGNNLFRNERGQLAVIHKSSRTEYNWQISYFDQHGPYGHASEDTIREAAVTMRYNGWKPDYTDEIHFQTDTLELQQKQALLGDATNYQLPGDSDRLPAAIDTPDFRKWFEGSKVVDENGQPLMVFHGTDISFNLFRNVRANKLDAGWYGRGFYFSADPKTAAAYSERARPERQIYPVYLKITNPYLWPKGKEIAFKDVEAERIREDLIEQGYDGVIVDYVDVYGHEQGRFQEVVAFYPWQIKSVFNKGAWSLQDDRLLYQDEKELYEEALQFDTWQEWRDFHEAMTPEADLSPEERAADTAWYKRVFKDARKLEVTEGTPDELDNLFIEDMADLGKMNDFLAEMAFYVEEKEIFQPADEAEQAELERVQELATRIYTEVHPTIYNNALRVGRGKALTERARKSILTLMSQAPRDYRALYTAVMQDDKYAVPEGAESVLPEIERPKEPKYARMSITQRLALARKMQNEDIARRLRSGEIIVGEELDQYIESIQEEKKALQKKITEQEAEIERGDQIIRNLDRKSRNMQEDLQNAETEHRRLNRQIRDLEERNRRVSQRLIDQREAAKRRMDDITARLKKKAAGREVLNRILAKKQLEDYKQEVREKEQERRRVQKIRQYKQRLAKRIMKKPSNAIAWEQREKIIDIQNRFDPNFRKVRPGEEGVIEAIREAIAEDKEYEGMTTPRLMAMATKKNMSTMTLEEMERTANFMDSLARYGRMRRQIWKFQRDSATMQAREAIVQNIEESGKYTEPPAAESQEAAKRRRGLKGFFRNFDYSFINMERKAIMLDNGKEGVNFKWLITEERRHRRDKLSKIKERQNPVMGRMKELGIKIPDLYKTHTIANIGPNSGTATYTTSDLMYVLAGAKNERSRAAMAYGNLVSAEEKKKLTNEEIIEIGDERFNRLHEFAERNVTQGEKQILELIEADFHGNFERLQNAAIEEFNIPVQREQFYVPIKRKEMTYEDLKAAVADDLLDLNATGIQRLPKRGMIKSRITIQPQHQKPTEMDLFGGWNKAIETQEHFINYTGYVREVNGIYKKTADAQNTRGMIVGAYGQEMMDDIDDFITELANPSAFIQRDNASKFLRGLRGDLGAAYLGWKLSSIVTQVITSPMPFLAYVNPVHLFTSYMRVLTNPIKAWNNVSEMSDIMRTRSIDPIFQAIRQGQKDQPGKKVTRLKELGMKGLEWADRISVLAGWTALYEQQIKKTGGDEQAAIEYADKITLRTQPSGQAEDLAPAFKTKQEAWRVFLQFQSQLNIIWQNIRFDMPTALKNRQFGRALGIAYSYMVAGALLGLAKEGFRKDDDERDKALSMLYWSLTQFTDAVPLLGSAFTSLIKGAITGKSDPFFQTKLYPAANTMMTGFRKLTQKEFLKALENFGYSAGYFIGAPVSGYKDIKRTLEQETVGKGIGSLIGRRY